MIDKDTKLDKVLLVIPAYNEAENIKRVIEELNQNRDGFDYLIINDGSKDDTGFICRRERYCCMDMPINVGLSEVFRTGMKYAIRNGYSMAMQYDGDGQHDPRYLVKMVEYMKEAKADVVIGSRYITKKGLKSLRHAGSCIIRSIIWLTTGKKISDPTSGMRLYNSRTMQFLAGEMNMAPEPDTIAFLIRNGFVVEEVEVEMRERQAGNSYLSLGSSVRYMANICVSLIFIQWFRRKKSESDV